MNSKITVLLAALVLFAIMPTAVQAVAPAEQWNKTFGGTSDDVVKSVQNTSDGGYILAGTTASYGAGGSDAWLIKVDNTGSQIWDKTFGGTLDDGANSVQQTTDGGYILAGATASYGAGGTDVWLIKVDNSGNQIWNKTFGGTLGDEANSVQQTSDGGYIIAGENSSNDSIMGAAWLIKVDSDGNHQWNKTFLKTDESYTDYQASSVDQTSDGGYIIAGWVEMPTAKDDFWLSKVDSNGNQIWSKTFMGSGGDYDHAYSVQQTSDGGYILAGEAENFGGDPGAAWLVKTDSNGNMTWDKRFGGGYETDVAGCAYSVQQTLDGGYILAGTIRSYGALDTDVWLIKVDSNGNQQWTKKFGGTEGDSAYSVQQASDGGYIIAGETISYGAGSADAWLIKVAPDVSTISSMAPTHDNRLRQSTPNTVLSHSNYIDIGRLGTTSYRDVMWFDLSGYNSAETISKATLSLYWYYPSTARTSDTTVEIYRPAAGWDSNYVTWNSRISGIRWNTAGGDWIDKNGVLQGSTPYASVTFPAGALPDNRYYEFDVTQLVQDINNDRSNSGFFLKARTEGNNYIAFYSSEWSNADQRPKLTITSVPTNNPPVAEAGPDQVVTIGETVTFNGSASTDDKGIATYSWDFDAEDGIGTDATGITATTSYATEGDYTVTLTVTDTDGQTDSDTLQVVVSGHTTTLTFTPTYDNRLRQSSPNTVFSSSNYIDIGRIGTSSYRDLMWFGQLANIRTVTKATLSLYWYYPPGTTRTSDTVVEIYRPGGWDQKYVTWNSRINGIPWNTLGGDWFDKNGVAQGNTPYASVTFPAGKVPDNKYYEFDVTQLVQDINNGRGDTGFFLKAKTENNNYIAFYSSEWSNADQRPKLTVTTLDAPPDSKAGPDQVTTTGSVVTFNGSDSTDDIGIVSYSWDFDVLSDGIQSEATTVTANHTYTKAGTYLVSLTIIDTGGQSSYDELKVVVTDPKTTYDNRLRQSSPNTVYSSTNYLDVGRLGTTSYRNVMWFDLSGYNSTDTISKATLSLYWYYPPGATRTSGTVVEIYRPVEWSPQYVTWNSRMSGTPWNTAGGNWFDKNAVAQGSAPYASVTFPAGTVPDNQYHDFDVTQLVQEYVSGTYDNTGFFFKAQTEGNNYIAFYSSEWSNVDQRPKLTVTNS